MGRVLPITADMAKSAFLGFSSQLAYAKLVAVEEVMTRPESEKPAPPRPSDAPSSAPSAPSDTPDNTPYAGDLERERLDLAENLSRTRTSRWGTDIALMLIMALLTAGLAGFIWLVVR
jgi:hypothetical protein